MGLGRPQGGGGQPAIGWAMERDRERATTDRKIMRLCQSCESTTHTNRQTNRLDRANPQSSRQIMGRSLRRARVVNHLATKWQEEKRRIFEKNHSTRRLC